MKTTGRKTKKPRIKKPSRKKLVKELDAAFSIFIRRRDSHCVLCGTTEHLTNGHLITRAAYSVRWDEQNCHCQCMACNLRHEYRPEFYTVWFINKFGEAAYRDLYHRSRQLRKFTTSDLLSLIHTYKEKNVHTEKGISV